MLRDRLVVGIKSDRIQRRLLAEPNLTFEKALEIATAMETAEKNAQDIQASGTNGTFQKQINKVSKSYTRNNSGNSKQGDCYRCGGNHLAAECRTCKRQCQLQKESAKLPLLIVKRKGPNLLGRDWLNKLQLDWKDIFSVVGSDNQSSNLECDLGANKEVFKDELGTVKEGMKTKIYVDESAVPKYPGSPFAAAPIVPVVKENGSIIICGDYKVTVNAVSKLDNYPIPKTEDLYATLGGGQEYTKLDLNQAYQQIELDEDSKRYVTINTHKGLFRYNRLPYGVASSPGIFQRTLENVVQGIANVLFRVDDILITGKTREEHLNTLSEVLSRFKRIGIRLKKQKCVFMAEEVVYLGFKINKHGIYPVESKVEAINKIPSPTKRDRTESLSWNAELL
ncbi:unnamed protein product [Mytilus edulis]|uniref:Reverse transcriptase domain-containing protein n=1 Tax=Mytilus edulis TaxID=6550 RepID=A0A8S3SM08_MYTED|nr:unnamed protein product [Mytilus edulis]